MIRLCRHAAIMKTRIEMLAHELTLCLLFLSRSQISRGTKSSLRTRLIGEMGTGSFGPGQRKRVAGKNVSATGSVVKRDRGASQGCRGISYVVTGHATKGRNN